MEYKFSFFNKLALAYVSIILVLPILDIIEIGSFIWITGILVGSYIFTMLAVDSFKKKSFLRFILSFIGFYSIWFSYNHVFIKFIS